MTEAATIRPGPFFLLPKGIVDSLGRAALRALDCLLWEDTRYATEASDATDRELAAAMGCSIRTAQRAIHDLANLVVDGVARPLIDRFRQYGPREVAGRRLRIIAPEVVPTAREDPAPASEAKDGPAPPKRKKEAPYNRVPAPTFTPEQLAAARDRAESAGRGAESQASPEDIALAESWLARAREQLAAEAAAEAAPKAPPRPPAARRTKAEVLAQIASLRARSAGPAEATDPKARE